ncbi:MAG: RDD family protein [Arenimonas sp.]
MSEPEPAAARPAAVPATLGWRLLAMLYDAIPVLPLAMLVSAVFLALHGGTPVSGAAWLLAQAILLWTVVGAYFVLSWRHGGQTVGMRPWRLRVVDESGQLATTPALFARYAMATFSLAAAGLGFAWSLVDRERRTWHDLASGTRLVRVAPR